MPLISLNGVHQMHIFIFFLAVFHCLYSAMTMLLGKLKVCRWKILIVFVFGRVVMLSSFVDVFFCCVKIRGWKSWEDEYVKEHEMMNGKCNMICLFLIMFFADTMILL